MSEKIVYKPLKTMQNAKCPYWIFLARRWSPQDWSCGILPYYSGIVVFI